MQTIHFRYQLADCLTTKTNQETHFVIYNIFEIKMAVKIIFLFFFQKDKYTNLL